LVRTGGGFDKNKLGGIGLGLIPGGLVGTRFVLGKLVKRLVGRFVTGKKLVKGDIFVAGKLVNGGIFVGGTVTIGMPGRGGMVAVLVPCAGVMPCTGAPGVVGAVVVRGVVCTGVPGAGAGALGAVVAAWIVLRPARIIASKMIIFISSLKQPKIFAPALTLMLYLHPPLTNICLPSRTTYRW